MSPYVFAASLCIESNEKMYGITNILFVVCAGLGALLVAIPLPKALASGNVGTSMLIVWTQVACLVQFVNAIRWHGNIENWAPAWCDFCGYFLLATDVALVASGVSINRRLYMIVTLDPRRHEKAFAFNTVVEVFLCLVIPGASIALQYVVQQYRFYIYEDVGCSPGIGTVNLAFPLVWMLPLFMGTVSAGYACLTLRASFRRKHGLMGEPGMWSASSRRLMALGAVSTMYGLVPTSIAIALLATASPVTPWPGWRAIHSTIDVIVYVPAQEWQSNSTQAANVELRRWTFVTLAFVVFIFLGFTADVKRMYCGPFRSFVEQTSSTDQTRSTVREQNTNGDLGGQKRNENFRVYRVFLQQLILRPAPRSPRCCLIPFGKPRAERRQEIPGLIDRPRLDSDVEGFQLVFPVPQPPAATHPTSPPWKLHYERGSHPAYI